MYPEDLIITQTVSLIAEEHGCHLTNIDICLDKNGERIGLIEIDGPEEKKAELAQAIEAVLEEFKQES